MSGGRTPAVSAEGAKGKVWWSCGEKTSGGGTLAVAAGGANGGGRESSESGESMVSRGSVGLGTGGRREGSSNGNSGSGKWDTV